MGPLLAAGVEFGLHGIAALCKGQEVSKGLQSLGEALDVGASLVGVITGNPASLVRAGAAIVAALADKGLVESVEEKANSLPHAFSHKA